nr:hypothetical protein K-LCC10_0014 [Kaumoebavirus]
MEDTLVRVACRDCLYVCKSWDAAARRQIEFECREDPNADFYWPLYWAAKNGFKKLVMLCLDNPKFNIKEPVYEHWKFLQNVVRVEGDLEVMLNNAACGAANCRYSLALSGYFDAWRKGDNDMVKLMCRYKVIQIIVPPKMREINEMNPAVMRTENRDNAIAKHLENSSNYWSMTGFVIIE